MPDVAVKGVKVRLTKNDFLASGGQGDLYVKGDRVFKIYHPDSDLIPESKIAELQVLKTPEIVLPEDPIFLRDGQYAGFTLPYVPDAEALLRLFTNSFRRANNVQDQDVVDLVERMIKVIAFVHSKSCLQIDGNEWNYLVRGMDPFFIDVDSYQTPSHPATVIKTGRS